MGGISRVRSSMFQRGAHSRAPMGKTMLRPLRVLLLSLACSAALTTYAQTAEAAPINIPPGDLVSALDALARQSGAQFVYRTDQLSGLRTPGVQGAQSAQEALGKLLQGSQFVAQRDA